LLTPVHHWYYEKETTMTNEIEKSIGVMSKSIKDYLSIADAPDEMGKLELVRLSLEPSILSFFTDKVENESVHYIKATETWSAGYVQCCGDQCPACRVGIELKKNLLLPVLDRVTGRVKILRVPTQRGPGKLLTEIGNVLANDDPSQLVVQVVRRKDFTSQVTIQSAADFDPESAAAVKRFSDALEDGAIDVRAVAMAVSAEEMHQHEEIAKRLKFMGGTN
jgi:hypothetical protein